MNGAESLLQTLVACGVDTCFTNPGTSEMHFVAALDRVPGIRAILGLQENVVTGAADGYARMLGKPAATLLHLGPGLANGLANLHNAKRAGSPMVNVIGDHATVHAHLEAPLASDVEGVARPFSHWVRTSPSARSVASDAAEAVAAAQGPPGRIASLILPADTAWNESAGPVEPVAKPSSQAPPSSAIDAVAKALRSGEPAGIVLNGGGLGASELRLAAQIREATNVELFSETFFARLPRGVSHPAIERLPYFGEQCAERIAHLKHLVLVHAKPPVSFFAYPGKPSELTAAHTQVHVLVEPNEDAGLALDSLASALGVDLSQAPPLPAASRPQRPTGALNPVAIATAVGALLPEAAIVVDEANTSGVALLPCTAGGPDHDWMYTCGGAIGQGMPAATGAAVACPDRRVLNLQADGSAMYTLQSLWTQARCGLDVTTVIFSNRSYAILNVELSRVGAQGSETARDLFDLARPELDFARLAEGMGVPACRATTAEEFATALEQSFSEPGPQLIDAVL